MLGISDTFFLVALIFGWLGTLHNNAGNTYTDTKHSGPVLPALLCNVPSHPNINATRKNVSDIPSMAR
jgi:hypothetical protein